MKRRKLTLAQRKQVYDKCDGHYAYLNVSGFARNTDGIIILKRI